MFYRYLSFQTRSTPEYLASFVSSNVVVEHLVRYVLLVTFHTNTNFYSQEESTTHSVFNIIDFDPFVDMTDPSALASVIPFPGLYPNDPNVSVRPAPIPATIVMRSYGKKVGLSPPIQKDINRWVKAVAVVGEYVRDHNEQHQGNLQMQYRWYDSSLSEKVIQSTLYRIVDDKAKEHISSLYGRYTYNEAQIRHGREMEQFVAKVAKDPMFDPLTQTVRLFGVRSVIETKMTTKRRALRQKEKRETLRNGQADAYTSASKDHEGRNGISPGVAELVRASNGSSQREKIQPEVTTTNADSIFN